jgi:expansin (peptidoglycan-binding protein)
MSTILNAILVWANTPGIEILEMTDGYVQIDSPKGKATVTLKEDTYEVASSSEQLNAKIEEIIERALAEEKTLWKRGHLPLD